MWLKETAGVGVRRGDAVGFEWKQSPLKQTAKRRTAPLMRKGPDCRDVNRTVRWEPRSS